VLPDLKVRPPTRFNGASANLCVVATGAAPRVLLVWWITCLLWSGTFLFTKIGIGQVPPLTFGWLRLLIALATLTAIALARRGFTGVCRRVVSHVMGAETVTVRKVVALAAGVVGIALTFRRDPLEPTWTASAVAALAYLSIGASVIAFGLNY
jgi:hypothetical protein